MTSAVEFGRGWDAKRGLKAPHRKPGSGLHDAYSFLITRDPEVGPLLVASILNLRVADDAGVGGSS
jgi:hypothetical protein